MTPLHQLATEVGLQIDWEDANGRAQRVSDDALRQVLGALGYSADTDQAIATYIRQYREQHQTCAFLSVDRGARIEIASAGSAEANAELELEDGRTFRLAIERGTRSLRLPPIEEIGYHRLHLGTREIRIAVAPSRCFGIDDIAMDRRLWGAAVQVPSLRDDRALPFGDFGTVAATAHSFAKAGADALAISPAHALFPADARRFSPYAPSSRLFLNILFGDPALIGQSVPPSQASALIDWETAIPERLALLRRTFDGRTDAVKDAVAAFQRKGGKDLEHHAIYDALYDVFFQRGAGGWQQWPAAYQDPDSAAVAEFAQKHRADVDFYIFAQWLAKTSLDAAQQAAVQGGMAIGLISDLAVGMDAGGSHVWSRRDDVLTGLSVGAPPDLLGPDGQNWGLTSFAPLALRRTGFAGFIATLRAALNHAGGIRIDHALGLRRLWVIPHGAASSEGAYLTYPLDDFLRVLAIESWRARAIVIGEDLGTVPEGLRPKLSERGVLGMRVLWFEREDDGGYIPAASWSREAVAMTGTHDLPTVAGWWSERDIDLTWSLGRSSQAKSEADDRTRRAGERERLWQVFAESGAAAADQPAPEDTQPVVDAALAHIGSTPSSLAILPAEDIFGLVEQPNLPGTLDEHPNWRRRMPDSTDAMLAQPAVAARVDRLNQRRKK